MQDLMSGIYGDDDYTSSGELGDGGGGGFGGGWNGGYNSYGSLPSLINQALARGGNTQLFNNYNGSWSVFENVLSSHLSVISKEELVYNGKVLQLSSDLSWVIADHYIYTKTQFITTYNGSNRALGFVNQQQKGGSEKGGVWGWMKEHFDVVVGYSESYGAQLGGGFKRVMEARVNLYSTVRTDFEWSLRKGIDKNKGRHNPGEKANWGAGVAYYGGVNYKGESFKGVTEHEVSIGIFGIGGAIKFDNSFNLTDWFIGFDPSVNMQFGVGIEGTFKIGFSK